jgi:hypothetical protein
VIRIDVLLEKLARRRVPVDVDLFDVDALCVQKTSGVLARRSGGLPVKGRFGHGRRIMGMASISEFRLQISD